MAYSLFWRSPALTYTQKQLAISVPAGSVVSNAASLRFTGKGAANYGKIQQENLMRLLENFAGDTEPNNATVGQLWYDTLAKTLKVATETPPLSVSPTADWRSLNATYITDPGFPPPANPVLGDTWFQRTGNSSGILHVYDRIGRYPLVAWDAHAAGLYPTVATTNAYIKLNTQTFAGAVGSNYGEAYISGYTGITPADVPGTITTSGGPLALPNSYLPTSQATQRAFIVYDAGGTLVNNQGTPYFQVRRVGFDAWEYDDNTKWVPMARTVNQWVIGFITVGSDDNNLAPGIASAELWTNGYNVLRSQVQSLAPLTKAFGSIGGWSQIWPSIEVAAGREEYESVFNSLMGIIGSPYTYGGSEAVGRSVQFLTDHDTLDASLWAKFFGIGMPAYDPNVANSVSGGPARVEPNSEDWDLLLAAMRYALNRLELSVGAVDDVSNAPFVQDGRPLAAAVQAFGTSDYRFPEIERLYNRRYGSVTMNSFYAETLNMLQAGVDHRYLLKGILGNSGTNTAFNSGVQLTSQQRFTIPATGLAGTVTHGLNFFPGDDGGVGGAGTAVRGLKQLKRFFYSGQAIDIVMIHTPSGSPTAQDANFAAMLASYGRIRITADSTFVMTPNLPTQLALAPNNVGYNNATVGGYALATITGSACSILIRVLLAAGNPNQFAVELDITDGGTTTGNFEVRWSYVDDTETWNNPGPVRVYPAPIPFLPAHQRDALFTPIGT